MQSLGRVLFALLALPRLVLAGDAPREWTWECPGGVEWVRIVEGPAPQLLVCSREARLYSVCVGTGAVEGPVMVGLGTSSAGGSSVSPDQAAPCTSRPFSPPVPDPLNERIPPGYRPLFSHFEYVFDRTSVSALQLGTRCAMERFILPATELQLSWRSGDAFIRPEVVRGDPEFDRSIVGVVPCAGGVLAARDDGVLALFDDRRGAECWRETLPGASNVRLQGSTNGVAILWTAGGERRLALIRNCVEAPKLRPIKLDGDCQWTQFTQSGLLCLTSQAVRLVSYEGEPSTIAGVDGANFVASTAMAIPDDGRILILSDTAGAVSAWSIHGGKPLWRIEPRQHSAGDAAIGEFWTGAGSLADRLVLWSAHAAMIVDVRSGERLMVLGMPPERQIVTARLRGDWYLELTRAGEGEATMLILRRLFLRIGHPPASGPRATGVPHASATTWELVAPPGFREALWVGDDLVLVGQNSLVHCVR